MSATICMIELFHDGRPLGPCAEVSSVTFWGACVHEHVDQGVACAGHADKLVSDHFLCASCRRIDGHECQFVFDVAELA